jgi:hypothetical protein
MMDVPTVKMDRSLPTVETAESQVGPGLPTVVAPVPVW